MYPIVIPSSIAVYGYNQLPYREDMRPEPVTTLGENCLLYENMMRLRCELAGKPWLILRFGPIYGLRYGLTAVDKFMAQIGNCEPMTVYGEGRQTRSWLCAEDAREALLRLRVSPGVANQIINVDGLAPNSVNYMAHVVAEAMNVEPNIVHVASQPGITHAFASTSKLRAYLPMWEPLNLEAGICKVARTTTRREGEPCLYLTV